MKKILLCILDGVGIKEDDYGNAFKNANTPMFDYLWNKYPHSTLDASGQAVGLPEYQMGNSEVGHSNIGAGRIVYQPLTQIESELDNLNNNKNILEVINHVQNNNSKIHLMGLLSDGGVHSHINHLFSLMELCKNKGLEKIYIHVFTDGRDVLPVSSIKYLEMLEAKIEELGIGNIATISGRYYAMDRDNRYDRVKKAYDAITGNAKIIKEYKDEIERSYEKNITDEFIEPFIVDKEGIIEENDGIIVYNYRPDRLRELFSAITNKEFKGFVRDYINNIKLVTMFPVSDEVVCKNAFEHQKLSNTLGLYLDKLNLTQLRIAETEKYAHVTYFFDGGKEYDLKGSKRILIPSPKVSTYDMKPEMSAFEITKTLIKELDNKPDLVVLNFANGDMVGHTGNYEKAIEAVEAVDKCLEKIWYNLPQEYVLVICADHGNCETMKNLDKSKNTSHTTNKVPFIICSDSYNVKDGKLSDIAPTILKIMGLRIPKEMNGNILI